VSTTFSARLHQQLKYLIARGTKVSNPMAGMQAARIRKWMREAEECLALLEDKTSLLAFQSIKHSQGHFTPPLEFKVADDDESSSSKSAYRPSWIDQHTGLKDGADVLLDFRFDLLAKANEILKAAAAKLEKEGHSSSPTLGEQLRAARAKAGHSQRIAAEKLGYDHHAISEWETGKRNPHPDAAKNIGDYIKKANQL
jgi:DNA-binding XRE family transcriptional regulator